MGESIEQTLPGPATYVPEPFAGLPTVFNDAASASRGKFALHRPRAGRRRTPKPETPEPFDDVARVETPASLPVAEATPPPLPAPEPLPVAEAEVPPPPASAPPPIVQVVSLPAPAPIAEVVPLPEPVLAPVPPPPAPAPMPVVELGSPPPAPAPMPVVELAPPPPPPLPAQPAPLHVPVPAPAPVPPPQRVFARMSRPAVAPKPAPKAARRHAAIRPGEYPSLPTYDPEPYDPSAAASLAAHVGAPAGLALGSGIVYPAREQHRSGARTALLLIVLLVAGFFAWRHFTGDTSSQAAASPPVVYRSHAGRFTAQFPNSPNEGTTTTKLGRNKMTLHFAGDPTTKLVLESAQFTPALPNKFVGRALRVIGRAFTQDGKMTLKSQRRTVFRGHPAQLGQFWALDGTPFTLLAVFYNSRQCYVFFGASGADFDALKKSFVARA